ncbi:MAG: hypothetical protein HY680_08790 [Chloroflexi bacterium]|nr:hypothetical protein [Chloroflexota bacterium]
MPISKGDFDRGRHEPAEVLLSFLREHSDQAFTLEELCTILMAEGYNVVEVVEVTEAALRALIERERVEVREIEETRYYTYRGFLGFRPSRGK